MDLTNLPHSKTFRGIVIGLGIAAVVLIIFWFGLSAGYRRAHTVERFGDSFERNFVAPHDRFFLRAGLQAPGVPGGHGVVGEIASIDWPELIVAGPDNLEKTVRVASTTRVREFAQEVPSTTLAVGDHVVILGVPDTAGTIDARLIRLLPPPPER